ncbi:SDR family NAD(P)-dependent oxidoreductase [bacterium]|nr:SDR family NAD(P)-dependent oxidoreductase [bacterium]
MTASPTSVFKQILITGASSGIGREMALQLASHAEQIWICGRNFQELEKTQTLIAQKNSQTKVSSLIGDLTDEADRLSLLNAVSTQPLDLVILNAGGGEFGLFSDSNWKTEKQVIDLNVTATVHLTQGLLPILKKTKGNGQNAAMVFVSSHAAFMHVPHFAVYASAKSFVNSFALTLMQEERDSGLNFLLACPGATATQFSERAGLPRQMLGAPKSATDVAHIILSQIGQKRFLIVNSFDRLLYLASRILPVFIFDAIVTHTQHKLLARATRQKEISL